MKVIVSGLTAAGKTTASLHLAKHFGVPYFSASEVLRLLSDDSSPYWTPELDVTRTSITDDAVDREMIRLLETSEAGIFDAWGLPWFTETQAVRIWLDSDPRSRQYKCCVSWIERGQPKSLDECSEVITAKDSFTRDLFAKNWGFDITVDRGPFDLLLDLSDLITRPTVENATVGIAKMNDYLVNYLESGSTTAISARLTRDD